MKLRTAALCAVLALCLYAPFEAPAATTIFKDQYGRTTGSMDADGTFRDSYGKKTGKLDKDGTVRDRYGKKTGSVR